MVTLGLEPHPSTHTVVALDENGASLGHLAVPNIPEGLIRLHEFGARFFSRRWAVLRKYKVPNKRDIRDMFANGSRTCLEDLNVIFCGPQAHSIALGIVASELDGASPKLADQHEVSSK